MQEADIFHRHERAFRDRPPDWEAAAAFAGHSTMQNGAEGTIAFLEPFENDNTDVVSAGESSYYRRKRRE